MIIHSLKVWPEYYQSVVDLEKSFEYRKNDRGYAVGDFLQLREYNPDTGKYTGREEIRQITYILQGEFGLPEGMCIMSLLEPL